MTVIFPEEAMAVLESLIFVSSKPVTAAALSRISGYAEEDVELFSNNWQSSMNSQGTG